MEMPCGTRCGWCFDQSGVAKREGRTNYGMKKYQCPCCGFFTYNVPADEDCGYICPVCFWENDPFITSDNEPSDSNHGTTLKEAKSNFLQFGACKKEMLCHVRPPRDDEKEIS